MPPGGITTRRLLVLGLVTLGRKDNIVPLLDDSALNHLRNQTATVKECFLEAFFFARELGWAFARVAVFNATHLGSANLELLSNKPHQLDVLDHNVATAFIVVKARTLKEDTVDERDLSPSLGAFIEATFAPGVSVTFQAFTSDCLNLHDALHGFTSNGGDTDGDHLTFSEHKNLLFT